jgi:hypothetical protein
MIVILTTIKWTDGTTTSDTLKSKTFRTPADAADTVKFLNRVAARALKGTDVKSVSFEAVKKANTDIE